MKKDIKNLGVIDAAHIFRRVWHASEHKPQGSAYTDTIDKIVGILEHGGYDAVICAIDAPPYLRKQAYPEYKSNRNETSAEMHSQYKEVQAELKKMGCHIWKSQGHEADDVIASIVSMSSKMNIAVDIHTNDKDLLQLINDADNIRVVSTNSGDKLDEKAVFEKMGTTPDRICDFLAILGDVSDNIPGCKGVGAVKAAKIVQTYAADKWDLFISDCKNKSVTGVPAGKSFEKNLFEGAGNMQISKSLVQLVYDIPLTQWSELYEEQTMGEEADFQIEQQINAEPEIFEESVAKAYLKEQVIADEIAEEVAKIKASHHPDGKGDSVESYREDTVEHPAVKAITVEEAYQETKRTGLAPVVPAEETQTDIVTVDLGGGASITNQQYALFKEWAKVFHDGKMYAGKFRSPQAIVTVMLLGRELGIAPQLMLQQTHMVEGKPTLASNFLIALATKDPDCKYFVMTEESKDSVTYETFKKSYGKPLTFTYTLSDAKQDGVRWATQGAKNQRSMLRKTAGSHAARNWYPAAVAGMYSTEEFGFAADEEDR